MTIDQLRDGITAMERNYELAMRANDQSLAQAFLDKRDSLWCDLRSAIQELEDNQPDWNRQWYDTSAELN
jgi:phage shock protein A